MSTTKGGRVAVISVTMSDVSIINNNKKIASLEVIKGHEILLLVADDG